MIRRLALLAAAAAVSSSVCVAQSSVSSSGAKRSGLAATEGKSPLANIAVAAARVLIPDGTSVGDDYAAGDTKWFVFQADRGKAYLIEVMDSVGDQGQNSSNIAVFESDGTTTLDTNEILNCGLDAESPGMNGPASPGTDGKRCAAYLFANSDPIPFITISVTKSHASSFKIRVRENNIVGRWSTNGYNMFVALQNSSAGTAGGYVLYYPSSAAGAGDFVAFDSFSLMPYGSVQFTRPAGALSSGRGLCRVAVFDGTDVNVQMYAFSPGANNFNFFATEKPNHGGQNSW